MNRRLCAIACVAAVLGGGVTVWTIRKAHDRRMGEARNEFLASRARWSEAVGRQRDDHERAIRREQLAPDETNPAATAKNPLLTIPQMVQRIAEVTSPTASRVDVHVDYFTEVRVIITLPTAPRDFDSKSAAKTVKAILTHCSAYVDCITFVCQDTIVRLLPRQAIENVKDWSQADLQTVQGLLKVP